MDKNSSMYKTILLAVVCSVAGACLAAVNAVTKPIITDNALAAVKTTLNQFYPDGTFSDVTSKYVTKDTDLVDGVYEAEGKGYIFTLHNTGYSSSGFKFAIAFNNDGTIEGYMALEQQETSGKGSLAFDQDYADEVKKLTSLDAMPLISGATITTSAVGAAVKQAETIFNSIANISGEPASQASASAEASSGATTNSGATSSASASSGAKTSDTLGTGDYASAKASCTATSSGAFACRATGFDGADVTATILVKDGAITSIKDLTGKDNGDGMGDAWYSDASVFNGATLDSSIDAMSGATFTSKAVKGMAAAALKAAAQQ
ncbi:MAG: FMN-binding protein [Solobacterium sp.]|jgi:Na+-translocating ferredoxin:NAD+ oxidoreductase RnfG subunit|nr:FMN-binding protein [Solobacterium sp.]MCH4205578.1 FMN-binding protein [Solobacterium sp.]MCH4227087.1 FMN-binding protein [Solobacterium sp.]MCH4282341.1 FMN-binding protein [Solobacterium sp.]